MEYVLSSLFLSAVFCLLAVLMIALYDIRPEGREGYIKSCVFYTFMCWLFIILTIILHIFLS